jgi:glycosyltransferase involved in cell wall biosynthesis
MKKKVLFCGDSISQITGLSNVLISIMKRFPKKDYEVGVCTITGGNATHNSFKTFGKEVYKSYKDINMYNCQINGDGCLQFDKVIEDFKPDIVVSIIDPWYLDQIAYNSYRDNYFWVQYLTVEVPVKDNYIYCYPEAMMSPTKVVPTHRKSIKDILARCDLVIPVTKLGEDLMESWGLDNYSPYVYNGIDFSCVTDKSKVDRFQVFKGIIKNDDFVVMSLGVNSERKMLGNTILAFYEFLKMLPAEEALKSKLYLHTNVNKMNSGTDLPSLVNKLGITNQVFFSSEMTRGQYVSKEDLYKKYAVSDVTMLLTGGEGFGYCFGESFANKVPTIYTDYGAQMLYANHGGLPVPIKSYSFTKNAAFAFGVADYVEGAKQLKKLYDNPKLRKELGESGYKYARKNFDWDKNVKDFIKHMERGYSKWKNPFKKFMMKKVF